MIRSAATVDRWRAGAELSQGRTAGGHVLESELGHIEHGVLGADEDCIAAKTHIFFGSKQDKLDAESPRVLGGWERKGEPISLRR